MQKYHIVPSGSLYNSCVIDSDRVELIDRLNIFSHLKYKSLNRNFVLYENFLVHLDVKNGFLFVYEMKSHINLIVSAVKIRGIEPVFIVKGADGFVVGGKCRVMDEDRDLKGMLSFDRDFH